MKHSRTGAAPQVLIGILALLAGGVQSSDGAAGLQHFVVRQVRQLDIGTPLVRAYLDLHDSEGNPIGYLPPDSLAATLGPWPATLTGLEAFDSARQGVAYVFLVDISKSLSNELFQQMLISMQEWIGDLAPWDRAAILAFGDSSVLVADFTDDPLALQSALRSLGPTDDQTVLHQALVDALEMSRRLDPELPGRRAIVIFSDGKDEGSSLVAEDVLNRFRDDPTPIYALGYSRLRDPAERERFLKLLDRFATNSGGLSYEVRQTRFSEAYSDIRNAIDGVWVADFSCDQCRPDSTVQRLQIRVDLDGTVLTSGGPVRLLPMMQAADTEFAETDGEGSKVFAPVQPSTAAPREEASSLGLWLMIGSALILVVATITYMRGLAIKRRAESAARLMAERSLYPTSPLDPALPPPMPEPRALPGPLPGALRTDDPAMAARPPESGRARKTTESSTLRAPLASKAVRLVVIRGSRQGKQYNLMVKGTAVVGNRSDSDCVLVDEPGIDARQFELYFDGVSIFIRNLSEIHPTLLNGQTIVGRAEISSNTLVGTDTTILRVVYE